MNTSFLFLRPIGDHIKRLRRGKRHASRKIEYNNDMWKRGILIASWVAQIIVCAIGLGLGGFALSVSELARDNVDHDVTKALDIDGAIWITWAGVSFILVITEMIMLLGKKKLSPLFAVVSYSVKSALWLVLLCFAIRNAAISYGGASSLIPTIIFFIVFFLPLIYVSIVYHRHRHGAYTRETYEYTQTENPNPFSTQPNSLQPNIEISSYESYRGSPSPHLISNVPSVPATYAARSEAYEPLRPGAGVPVLPSLDNHSSFHDRNLASDLAAAEKEHANAEVIPHRESFDPYRAPAPVKLVGSPPPPASSIYSQPERRIA